MINENYISNEEYRQALYQVENMQMNLREVDPEFYDTVYLELLSAEERVMAIIRKYKKER